MTLRKDDMDVWLEAALDFIRDELRTNAQVGLGAHDGARAIEVGSIPLNEYIRLPESAPMIGVSPVRDRPERGGNVIDHHVQLEVQVVSVAVLEPLPAHLEAQRSHRDLVGRVWNELLDLRDAGVTAGHWSDWWASGDVQWLDVPLPDRALLGATLRFTFLAEKVWQEGIP